MWNLLVGLGVLGGFLLAVSLYALYVQQRTPPESRTGVAKLPRALWLVGVVVSIVFVYLGLNATAVLPGPDQQAIEEDIKAFDEEFDDLE
jgi:hypothetical protein